MRILVTGHKGYIGAVLVPMLIELGHEPFGIDTDFYHASTFCDGLTQVPEKRMDIREIEVADLVGFDVIIHLAALSNDPLGDLNPKLTYEINHEASLRLATLGKQAGVGRFLFSSSCSTYGAGGNDLLDENAAFNPVTAYGHSKVLAERDISQLADGKFSPIFMRNTTAYGVSPRLRFDLVLNNLVAHAFASGLVYLKSDGTPWRPIIHVEDICSAFVAALDAPQELVHNQAFNVGITEENHQIRTLAEIVRQIVPGSRIEYAQGAGPDRRSYRVDFAKINQMLPDFKPRWNARLGAQQLYESYRQNQLAVEDFEGLRFKRIDQIKHLIGSGRLDGSLYWTRQL